MFALGEHHLTKGEIVVDGGNQSPGSRREGRWAAPLASLGLIIDDELPAFGVGPVAGRQPVERCRRHAETGVLHAERPEDAFSEERLKRLTRGARNQYAQYV